MDLAINTLIQHDALSSFLEQQYASDNFFLLYPGITEWDDVPHKSHVFQFHILEDRARVFHCGISIFMPADNLLPFLEKLAFTLSNHFDCDVVCDASRIILNQRALYYSLLFSQGNIYLVDDRYFEETGETTKVVALTYQVPDV